LVLVGVGAALAERALAIAWYGRWFSQGLVGDASVHYTIIRQLKKDWRSRWIEQYLISLAPMSYPTGFHRYAGLFSLGTLRRRPWLPNLILAALAYPAFLLYADRIAPGTGPTHDHFVVVAGVVFVLSTSQLVFRGPGIAYLGLSERYLARLSCSATFAFLVGARLFGSGPSWWLAAGAAAGAVLCSVFARQALLFSTPVLALVWWDWRPLLVVVGGFALALVISRGHLAAGLRHTVVQWRLYATHTKRSRLQRGVLSYYVRPAELWTRRHQPRELAEELVRREPTRTLLASPELVLLAVVLLVTALSGHVGRLVLGPPVAALAVYLATSTDRLNHLGESYRYLEYELYFVTPLLVAGQALFLSWGTVVLLLALYLVAVAAAVVLWVRIVPRHSLPIRPDELSAFMDGIDKPEGTVVYPIPMTVAPEICARYETCRSFWWQPGIMMVGIYDKFIEEFPFLKRDFCPLFKEFEVTLVVCDKSQLQYIDWTYDLTRLVPVKEDQRFAAYRVA
jgi:hypothetical protein